MGVCVSMNIGSEEIELESPGCSGFEANSLLGHAMRQNNYWIHWISFLP